METVDEIFYPPIIESLSKYVNTFNCLGALTGARDEEAKRWVLAKLSEIHGIELTIEDIDNYRKWFGPLCESAVCFQIFIGLKKMERKE
jgi:hypothetical protein